MDQAHCHCTNKVKNTLTQNNIKNIYVPKIFTNLLQPADGMLSEKKRQVFEVLPFSMNVTIGISDASFGNLNQNAFKKLVLKLKLNWNNSQNKKNKHKKYSKYLELWTCVLRELINKTKKNKVLNNIFKHVEAGTRVSGVLHCKKQKKKMISKTSKINEKKNYLTSANVRSSSSLSVCRADSWGGRVGHALGVGNVMAETGRYSRALLVQVWISETQCPLSPPLSGRCLLLVVRDGGFGGE
ncbi:hypothetical protein BpHYR1_022236 [Brachionus plicatilis]|uniref:Uncharacterized protein n=1 Tax=Brachionus plicatilis TaxID=10195 RepID=A0A3M7T5A8_BRAPC|nr:hypothetical protein BpHYR1_022236 [Brachionus plicatilis]